MGARNTSILESNCNFKQQSAVSVQVLSGFDRSFACLRTMQVNPVDVLNLFFLPSGTLGNESLGWEKEIFCNIFSSTA